MDFLLKIEAQLRKKKIVLDRSSLRELPSKGFMSEVYCADSNKGMLIIHILTPVAEQRIQGTMQKIEAVAKLLERHPEIPAARVYCQGTLARNKSFSVQSLIEGKPMGKRIVVNGEIADTYYPSQKNRLPQVLRAIARIHSINVKGFGYFDPLKKGFAGRYVSWQEFLRKESRRWIAVALAHTGKKSVRERAFLEKLRSFLPRMLKKYDAALAVASPRLIHGDMVNPGNILVKDSHISGIIDFEWALAGDPAWEFAFTQDVALTAYFQERRRHGPVDEDSFFLRMRIYALFWLLWGVTVHANGGPVKKILLRMLRARFDAFEKNEM